MKYPRPEGPRTKKKRAKRPKPDPIPHKLVEKTIYGQKVWVKVYEPAWAAADRREKEELGLIRRNPFLEKVGRGDKHTKPTPWESWKTHS